MIPNRAMEPYKINPPMVVDAIACEIQKSDIPIFCGCPVILRIPAGSAIFAGTIPMGLGLSNERKKNMNEPSIRI